MSRERKISQREAKDLRKKVSLLKDALEHIASGMPHSTEVDKFAHARYFAATRLATILPNDAPTN